MSENCGSNCSSCGETCADRKNNPEDFRAPLNEMSSVKKVIGVVSGKGGVGKSMVTSMLSVLMNKKGHKVGVLDADITGPSIPAAFGITDKADSSPEGIFPIKSRDGISVMSVNLLLEDSSDPVIWRGPMIADVAKQFWTTVVWDEIDYMFVDMPPGTGDVPLTIFQSLPVDGIVVVATPQDLVGMIVEKAIKMANMMNIPILGIVENMSYFECPDCGKQHKIFGESHIDDIAVKYNINTVCKLPINPAVARAADNGTIEDMDEEKLYPMADVIENIGVSQPGEDEYEIDVRVAVAYNEDGTVFQHFGHTEKFKVYDLNDGKVVQETIVDAHGSGHGALAGFLSVLQVDALICGGIGAGAREALDAVNIAVFAGVSGNCDEAVQALMTQTLDFDPYYACSHHAEGGDHDCGSHEGQGCGGHTCGHH